MEFFMRWDLIETLDVKGKIALQHVRYRTEISIGFRRANAKFVVGMRCDSGGAA
jgi:hypothetical protein